MSQLQFQGCRSKKTHTHTHASDRLSPKQNWQFHIDIDFQVSLHQYLNRREEERKQIQHDVSDVLSGKICAVNNTFRHGASSGRTDGRRPWSPALGRWRTVWETGSISGNDWSAMCAPPNSGPDHGRLSPRFTSSASTEMCHYHLLASKKRHLGSNSASQPWPAIYISVINTQKNTLICLDTCFYLCLLGSGAGCNLCFPAHQRKGLRRS